MRLSIIYVNYNTEDLLIDSLKSLKKNLSLKLDDYEVLVIDNASKQLNKKRIKRVCKDAKIIELRKNYGFGQGNNKGVGLAEGEYIWLLNTDTLVPKENNLHKLLDFLSSNRDYAAALPLLTDEQGSIQPTQTDDFPSLYRLIVLKPFGFFSRLLTSKKNAMPAVGQDVDVAVAAALVISKKVFQQIDGFDGRYFMYYEDTDLCKAVATAGYKIRFFPSAHIIHLWGRSISSSSSRKKYYYESQNKYFKKWHGAVAAAVLRIFRAPLYIKNVILAGTNERKDT